MPLVLHAFPKPYTRCLVPCRYTSMSGIDPVQLSCMCHKQNQYHENRSEYNIDVLFGTEGDALVVQGDAADTCSEREWTLSRSLIHHIPCLEGVRRPRTTRHFARNVVKYNNGVTRWGCHHARDVDRIAEHVRIYGAWSLPQPRGGVVPQHPLNLSAGDGTM